MRGCHGSSFCDKCSRGRAVVPLYTDKQRVCSLCERLAGGGGTGRRLTEAHRPAAAAVAAAGGGRVGLLLVYFADAKATLGRTPDGVSCRDGAAATARTNILLLLGTRLAVAACRTC